MSSATTTTLRKDSVEKKVNTNAKESIELELMAQIKAAIEAPVESREKDADDLFGMMVTKELKGLSKQKKRKLKHEINNLIFQFQEEEDEENNIQNFLNSTPKTQIFSASLSSQMPSWQTTQLPVWNSTQSSTQTPFVAPWSFTGLNTNSDKQSADRQ